MNPKVKNCSIIYTPKGQAGEYSRLATNPYRGCGHACTYCYVPKVLRMSRHEFDNDVKERPGYLDKLAKDAKKYQAAGIIGPVMLSFTTDPYNHLDVERRVTRHALEIIQGHGMAICTLTKGGKRALRDIDLFRPGIDSFATTLTSLDDQLSLAWEPKAALPHDRIETLQTFHNRGVKTWVSLEPVYDIPSTLEIIKQTHSFVNLFKIGRINYHHLTKSIDWAKFARQITETCERLQTHYYLKDDLRSALAQDPDGRQLIYSGLSYVVHRSELD